MGVIVNTIKNIPQVSLDNLSKIHNMNQPQSTLQGMTLGDRNFSKLETLIPIITPFASNGALGQKMLGTQLMGTFMAAGLLIQTSIINQGIKQKQLPGIYTYDIIESQQPPLDSLYVPMASGQYIDEAANHQKQEFRHAKSGTFKESIQSDYTSFDTQKELERGINNCNNNEDLEINRSNKESIEDKKKLDKKKKRKFKDKQRKQNLLQKSQLEKRDKQLVELQSDKLIEPIQLERKTTTDIFNETFEIQETQTQFKDQVEEDDGFDVEDVLTSDDEQVEDSKRRKMNNTQQ